MIERNRIAFLLLTDHVRPAPPREIAQTDARVGLETRVDSRTDEHRRPHARDDGIGRGTRTVHVERRLLGRGVRGVERQPRALEGSGALEIAFEFLSEPLPSERLHEELQAIALLVLVVTQPMEHADDRFGHDEHVGGRKELVEHLAGTRQRGGAPRDGHEKPALLESVGGVPDPGAPPDVVDRGGDVVVGAAFERDLELAREAGTERMPQQIARQRFGVRRDVEDFVCRHAGVRARRDVPDGVAARLARRQARVGQPAHRQLDVVQLARSGTAGSAAS